MEQTIKKVEELAEHMKEYVDNRVASIKLGTAEKGSAILANILAKALLILIFLLVVVFGSVGLAYVIARFTGALYLGFFAVSGIYLLLALLVMAGKEWLLRLPIMNAILRQFFKTEEDEKDS